MVMAIIAKNAGRIAREYLSIANDIEDLRQKKRLNKIIEAELAKQQKEIQEKGIEDTVIEVKGNVPKAINQEAETLLIKSIKKYFNFYKLGGDVDFISNQNSDEEIEDDYADEALLAEIAQNAEENQKLISVIESVREQENQIKQLENSLNLDLDDE